MNEPIRVKQAAYVVFREEGYIDVLVDDAHNRESHIVNVEAWINLTSATTGDATKVTLHQDAQRLDDGGMWGSRMAVPRWALNSSSQEYTILVQTNDGVQVYKGGHSTTPMDNVSWEEQGAILNPDDWDGVETPFRKQGRR